MEHFLGFEAFLALDALTLCPQSESVAEDESDYGSEEWLEQMEASQLLNLVRIASTKLQSMGISSQDIFSSIDTSREEPIRITDNYRIFLPNRGNMEIEMRPLVKALFILFLKHPEGIRFKELSDYRKELLDIYGHISHRSSQEDIVLSVEKLINPIDNSVNISSSRLSRALSNYFDKSTLGKYVIQGAAGQPKSIALNRSYVIWE